MGSDRKPGRIQPEGDDHRSNITGGSSMRQATKAPENQDVPPDDDLCPGVDIAQHYDVSGVADYFAGAAGSLNK